MKYLVEVTKFPERSRVRVRVPILNGKIWLRPLPRKTGEGIDNLCPEESGKFWNTNSVDGNIFSLRLNDNGISTVDAILTKIDTGSRAYIIMDDEDGTYEFVDENEEGFNEI